MPPSLTATCECSHAGMWHKPDCRIPGCDCEKFVQATIRRDHKDGSWMQHGKPTRARSRNRGPQE